MPTETAIASHHRNTALISPWIKTCYIPLMLCHTQTTTFPAVDLQKFTKLAHWVLYKA
jgi:hypothetical protein